MLPFGAKNIQEFVEIWNKKIPIDRWYRIKYNIPFNSVSHRSISLADMFFEFYEFIKYSNIKDKNVKEESPYIKGKGNFMKDLSSTEIDKLFDELDIDNID